MNRKTPLTVAAALTAALSAAPALAQDTMQMDMYTLYNLANADAEASLAAVRKSAYEPHIVYLNEFRAIRALGLEVASGFRAATIHATDYDWYGESTPRETCVRAFQNSQQKIRDDVYMTADEIDAFINDQLECSQGLSDVILAGKVVMTAEQVGALNEWRNEALCNAFAWTGFPTGIGACNAELRGEEIGDVPAAGTKATGFKPA